MTEDWERDGRQMPDQVLEQLRKIAVRAVEAQEYSPEVVIGVLRLNRSGMYDQLQRYQTQGLKGLESHPAPGAEAQVTEVEVAFFLAEKFPHIQRLAKKLGADMAFEDEAGIGVRTRCGRTWGLMGGPPEIRVTDRRGGYTMLSVVTGQGQMRYSLEAGRIDSAHYAAFLQHLLKGRTRPLIRLLIGRK